jgi:hypothetical protein
MRDDRELAPAERHERFDVEKGWQKKSNLKI